MILLRQCTEEFRKFQQEVWKVVGTLKEICKSHWKTSSLGARGSSALVGIMEVIPLSLRARENLGHPW